MMPLFENAAIHTPPPPARSTGFTPLLGESKKQRSEKPNPSSVLVANVSNGRSQIEAWFASPEDFERQCGTPMLTCPLCGSGEIRRVPAGLHVAKHGRGSRSDWTGQPGGSR